MNILKSRTRSYLLLLSLSLLSISPLTSLSGADFQPSNAEAQRAVEKALQSVAQQMAASGGELIPVGFVLPASEAEKKRGWQEQFVAVPSATVVPDFRQKALKELQTNSAALLAGKHIEGYFIIYEKDKQLHLISQEKDGAEKRFTAAYPSRAEVKNLKISDFKAK